MNPRTAIVSLFTAAILSASLCAIAQDPDPMIPAAEAGDRYALNHLCLDALYGEEGRQQDFTQALLWCKKGAETGDPNDETLYAEIYFRGDGVPKDISYARQWYKRAAEQGHPHAQFMMARLAYFDRPIDGVALCYWLKRAVAQHYDKAQQFYDYLSSHSYPVDHKLQPLCDNPALQTSTEPQ